MDLRNEDLPATLQAFDLQDNKEIFIAEQIVNSQAEIETFTSRYAGKLIKAMKSPAKQVNSYATTNTEYRKAKTSSTSVVMIIIILILVALVIYGFSTGWIQEKLNIKV